jgi:AcrR family transcriptional regulator
MSAPVAPEGTRARVLAAAATEIRQIGPRRMTISGIAGRLGMSHANVYRYFADKQAIVDAVLNIWLRELETRLQDIADGPDPADDKLERFFSTLSRAYVETCRHDPALFRLLAGEAGEGAKEGTAGVGPDAPGEEAIRHRRRIEALAERIVEEGTVTRLFAGGEARRLATLVLDLAHRFCDPGAIWRHDRVDPASDARRDRTIRAAIRAISVRK